MAQKASTSIPISRKTKLRLEKMKKSIARRIGRAVSYDEAIRTLLGRPTTRPPGICEASTQIDNSKYNGCTLSVRWL